MRRASVRQNVAPKFRQFRTLIYTGVSVSLILLLGWAIFVLNLGKTEDAEAAPPSNYSSVATGNWTTATTWNTGSAPPTTNLSDNIFINGHTVTRTGNLDVGNGASITINSGRLIINGDLIVQNDLTLMINGELTVNGNIDIKNGSSITVNGSGKLSTSGNVAIGQNANFNVDGVVNIGGNLSFGNNANFRGNGQVNVIGSGCSAWSGPGSCSDNASLPVELADFAVTKVDGGVKITWKTATEQNNDFFTVERSVDGKDYEYVAKVTGSGTVTTATSYSHTDQNPKIGRSYYRLSQTDYDGTRTIFKPAMIEIESNETNLTMSVYPNPFDGPVLNIELSQPSSGTIELIDGRGNVIASESIVNEEQHELRINKTLQPGAYYVNLKTSSGRQTVKVIRK